MSDSDDTAGRSPKAPTDDDLLATVPVVSPQTAAALAQAATWVGADIVGVAVGRDQGGAECVVVFAQSSEVSVPQQVDGVAVRVEVTGDWRAY